MKKYLIAVLVGILLTAVFGVLAGFGGGACHCSTPQRILFPYGSLLADNAEWETPGIVLFGLQCPIYALSVAMPRSPDWRAGVLLGLLALHGCAVAAAFQMSR
jgi:hypothetical protein